jgi:hypothetical protein
MKMFEWGRHVWWASYSACSRPVTPPGTGIFVVAAGYGLDQRRVIRDAVLSHLAEQSWSDFGGRDVIVSDGEVHLWGLVGSEAERKAPVAIAEGVRGVAEVIDEMIPAH